MEFHCYDCHGDGVRKGGLDLQKLKIDLDNEATFVKWERVFDRVMAGEMPPKKKDKPSEEELAEFQEILTPPLTAAHAAMKGTVLRRLNRFEYQNTLNDIFGTNLTLTEFLPEDGRAGGFDTVGDALGISLVQMERYLEAAGRVVDAAAAKTASRPEAKIRNPRYDAHSEVRGVFLNKVWGYNDDKAVVFYKKLSYPTGDLRGSEAPETGRYRIKVTGYNHQSDEPVTFSIGGSSRQKGTNKPIYAFSSFPLGGASTVEVVATMEKGYMVSIEPWGIIDKDGDFSKVKAKNYRGPGVAILNVEIEGPLLDEWPSAGHRLMFDGVERTEIEPASPKERGESSYTPEFSIENPPAEVMPILKRIAAAALRRPVVDSELIAYRELLASELARGQSFEEALRAATIAIFTSPDFLYLREKTGKLDEYAVASRLSYFLSRTTPDPELLRLAAGGKLIKQTRQQAERLIADPRFERFVSDFTDSWLNLREMNATAPDTSLYFEYDEFLERSMIEETRAFFRHLVEENLPVKNIVKSDFAFLNSRLAEHYGIEGVVGPQIRKVKLPEGSVRGGFLSQASVLKVSANGTNTSPVLRGGWILERIFGQTPAPPPEGIGGVEPDIRGATTLRELLAKHRDSTSCNSCHRTIDPPGFALESFDPVGAFRETFRVRGGGEQVKVEHLHRWYNTYVGAAVDASGELPDGRTFDNYIEFRDMIAEDQETLARNLVSKFLTFSTGREMGFSDKTEINGIVAAAGRGGYRVRDLMMLAVESTIFLTK